MAKKRKNARVRRKQKRQRQNMIIAGVALLVVGMFALFAISHRANVYDERFDLEPIYGNPNAPVSIIEYGAYGCHACKQVHESGILEQIIEEYDGQVNLIFRDIPIISPQYDFMAAQLAQCVLDQSNDLYWKFHDMLYTVAQQSVSTREQLVANAETLGIDTDALNDCYNAGTHVDTVRYDQQRGLDAGVRGTPTFFINGERLFNFSPETFRATIDGALNS